MEPQSIKLTQDDTLEGSLHAWNKLTAINQGSWLIGRSQYRSYAARYTPFY